MDTKVIPLRELSADLEGILSRCVDAGQNLVVELPGRRLVSIQPVSDSEDDLVNDLIEHDAAFRQLLAESIASPVEPFEIDSDLLERIERARNGLPESHDDSRESGR